MFLSIRPMGPADGFEVCVGILEAPVPSKDGCLLLWRGLSVALWVLRKHTGWKLRLQPRHQLARDYPNITVRRILRPWVARQTA